MPVDAKYVPVITTVVFGFLASMAVALRLWSRMMRSSLWWDDWLSLAGLVIGYGITLPVLIEIFRVAGESSAFQHTPVGAEESMEGYLKAELALSVVWDTSLSLTKLSALFFFYRTFPLRWLHRAYYGVGAALLLAWLLVTWSPFYACRPLRTFWEGVCPLSDDDDHRAVAWTLASGIVDVVFDFVILSLPMPALWRLQLSWKKKLFVTAIFGLGYFTSIISAIRMRVITQLSTINELERSTAVVWNYLEACLSTIVVCLPVVGPALGRIRNSMMIFPASMTKSANSASGSNQVASGKKPFGSSFGLGSSSAAAAAAERRERERDDRGYVMMAPSSERWRAVEQEGEEEEGRSRGTRAGVSPLAVSRAESRDKPLPEVTVWPERRREYDEEMASRGRR